MNLQNYIDRLGPVVSAAWLNAVDLIRFAYDLTAAEISSLITPSNLGRSGVCIIDIARYGGAPGAGDNTAAMNRAQTVLAAQGGGTIMFPVPGEWRMNWTCITNGITLIGPGGNSEFNTFCIRPFNIANGPAITVGNGILQVRYFRMYNLHLSGMSTSGATGIAVAANSASSCLKLSGVVSFAAYSCVLYDGVRVLEMLPTVNSPLSDINFYSCVFRNDITDSALSRCIFATRLADPGYFTDVNFYGCKFNSTGLGYAIEADGTTKGFTIRFIGGYVDCAPGLGVLLKGAAAIHTSADFDLDPGTTGVVVVETNQAQADPTRFISGNLTHGGQKMKFAAGVTVDIPAEADFFFYQPRIQRAFIGDTTFFNDANNPFGTNITQSVSYTAATVNYAGAKFIYSGGMQLTGADVILEFLETDQGADGKLWFQRANSGALNIQTRTDVGGAGKVGLALSRSGTTIVLTELGNATDLPPNRLHGHLQITDGVAAPSTAAGFGAIYIDVADGDLKIKFGDGTVKTIVVDT